jgi:hypothetical protein
MGEESASEAISSRNFGPYFHSEQFSAACCLPRWARRIIAGPFLRQFDSCHRKNIGRVWSGELPINERRTKRRQRTFKAAKIIFNQQRSVLDCTARDITETGACLVVGSSVGLPEVFELRIPIDNVKHSCRVMWRSPDRVGVKFIIDE